MYPEVKLKRIIVIRNSSFLGFVTRMVHQDCLWVGMYTGELGTQSRDKHVTLRLG